MTSPSEPALVLVGPMGAGKTSIGKRVAKTLGLTFRDTDAIVVREHGPIPELFASRGEAHFREVERAAVQEALSQGGVISLGGGSVLDASTRADLREHRVAFLTVSVAVVSSRIAGAGRPLLGGADPLEEWERILAARMPLYTEVADAVFDTSSGPLSDVAVLIADWAREAQPKGSVHV